MVYSRVIFRLKSARIIVAVAVALIATLLSPVTSTTAEASAISIERIKGSNRYETAVAVSGRFFPQGATDVVLVTGENYPDALAAAPLARERGAPILLTAKQALPTVVQAEIRRLGASRVTVIGGDATVSTQVLNELRALGLSVDRISGTDRFETATRVGEKFLQPGDPIAVMRGVDERTFGDGFADALSSATLGMSGDRIGSLLVSSTQIPLSVKDFLDQLGSARATVVGGNAAVSPQVYNHLGNMVGVRTRLSGGDRYATSVAVAEATERTTGISPSTLIIASGQNFPDSVVAGALTAMLEAPLLLVPPVLNGGSSKAGDRLAAQVPDLARYLRARSTSISSVIVLGGISAVDAGVINGISEILGSSEVADEGGSNGGSDGGGGGTPPPTTVPEPDPDPGPLWQPVQGFEGLGQPIGAQITTPFDTAVAWTTGPDAGQTDLDGDPFQREQVALASGKVLDHNGDGLAGVQVEVAGYPEFGHTKTNDEGEYLLAFNGGGQVVLEFSLTDYLPSQRRINFGWGDWLEMPNVVLLKVDTEATLIDTNEGGLHVASTMTDADGTRTGRIYIHPETVATKLGSPDEVLAEMNLRVTEYTVGPLGEEAMPGDLPPSIGYTYAAEVSVDGVGDAPVALSKPASMYLDNFLRFQIGTHVPLGLYERGPAAWIPSPDGVVMKVHSINGGVASLDIDGTGAADDNALIDIGFRSDPVELEAELRAIANTFNVGDEFWRVQLPHFSTPDLNFPVSTRKDRNNLPDPPGIDPTYAPADSPRSGEPGEDGFGLIRMESGAMVETIAAPGAPFELVHSSDRVPGYETVLRIPIWDPAITPDDEMLHAFAEISVGGRSIESTKIDVADLRTNPIVEIPWDGRDRYGRMLVGSQSAVVRVYHAYKGYFVVPAQHASSFGVPPTGQNLASDGSSVLIDARSPIAYKTTVSRMALSGPNWDNVGLGLGGWGLSILKGYDPLAKRVFLGDGSTRTADVVGPEFSQIGLENSFTGIIRAIETAPDGTTYVADNDGLTIKKIAVDGTVSPFAGVGSTAGCLAQSTNACGDGGAATAATLQASDLAIDRDGNVYIGDVHTNRVRMIDATGNISTVVGTGESCDDYTPGADCGDGGSATSAKLQWESFTCGTTIPSRINVAIGPDNSIWVGDASFDRVRRVGSDGIIETVYRLNNIAALAPCPTGGVNVDIAANPADLGTTARAFYTGNNSQLIRMNAESADSAGDLFISDFIVRADGTLIFAEHNEHDSICDRIRALEPGGKVVLVAGNAEDCGSATGASDGSAALGAKFKAIFLSESSDGSLLFSTGSLIDMTTGAGLRRISPGGKLGTVINWQARTGNLPSAGDPVVTAPNNGVVYHATTTGDGTVLVAYSHSDPVENTKVLVVNESLPGFGQVASGELIIPDPSGTFLDVFTYSGRHERIVSALTDETLFSFVYDSQNNIETVIQHELDSNNDLKTTFARTFDEGALTGLTIEGPFGHKTILVLDPVEVESLDGPNMGSWLSAVTDPAGGETKISTTPKGQITEIIGALAGSIYTFEYDQYGRITKAVDPVGMETTLAEPVFDGDKATYTLSSTHGGQTLSQTVVTEILQGGLLSRTLTDENGAESSMVQNADGTVELVAPDGTVTVNTMAADPRFGLAAAYIAKSTITTPGPQPSTLVSTVRSFDAITEVLTEITEVEGREVSSTTYDSGARTFTNRVGGPGGVTVVDTIDLLGRITGRSGAGIATATWVWDSKGRITSITETETGGTNSSRALTNTYDDDPTGFGHLKQQEDPLGNVIHFETDENGRITEVTLPDGTTTFTKDYNDAGFLTELVAPGGGIHTQAYDPLGNMTVAGFPELGGSTATVQYGYSPLTGFLTSMQRPGEGSVGLTYNNTLYTGRNGAGVVGQTWEYNAQNQLETTKVGDSISNTFGWDGFLLTSETTSLTGGNRSLTSSYDDELRLSNLAIDGTGIAYAYDPGTGFLTNIGTGSEILTYDNAGRVASRKVGDTTVSYSYNNFGEITEIEAVHSGDVVTDVLYKEEITRDALGRVTERIETTLLDTVTWRYDYDANGRLIEVVQGAVTRTYTYDVNGNRTSQGTYNARDQIETFNGKNYSFDLAGDLTDIDETSFDYDATGSLRSLIDSGNNVTFAHDGLDRRVGRTEGGSTTEWLYDLAGRLVAEYEDGALASRFVYGASGITPDYMIVNGENQMIISDWRGSPRFVVAANGGIVQQLNYDEWGALTSPIGDGHQPFGFQGGLVEPTTGLVRFGARDYDPATGRFTAMDPTGFGGGQTNLYVFANNDPINFSDHTGFGPATPNNEDDTRFFGEIGGAASLSAMGGAVGIGAGVAYDGERVGLRVRLSAGAGVGLGGAGRGYVKAGQSGPIKSGVNHAVTAGGGAGAGIHLGGSATVDSQGNKSGTFAAGLGVGGSAELRQDTVWTLALPTVSEAKAAVSSMMPWN